MCYETCQSNQFILLLTSLTHVRVVHNIISFLGTFVILYIWSNECSVHGNFLGTINVFIDTPYVSVHLHNQPTNQPTNQIKNFIWCAYYFLAFTVSSAFFEFIRGGADKSLVRHTSRCRRTESTMSLARGVCSCTELQVFFCYRGWKEACQATRAISTTWRHELSSRFFFPARQGAEGNSRHSGRNMRGTCTIVCHRQKLGGPV